MGKQPHNNISLNTGHRLSARVFRFAAVVVVSLILIQPLAAFAEETTTTIDDTTTQNPAQQEVTSGTVGTTVDPVTHSTYSAVDPTQTNTGSATPPDTSSNTPAPDPSANPPVNTEPAPDTGTPPLGDPAPDAQATPPADETTPPPSDTTTTTSEVKIINTNNLDVKTVSDTTADTGTNSINTKGDVKNANLVTGDVNVFANVLTVANINLVNSQIVEMNDNFNKLAANLYLNQPELSSGERTQDLVSPLCSGDGVACQSITTFKLSNTNTANVENDVSLTGNTGGNNVNAKGDIKDSSITTGNVNAVINVLNIVNVNAVNSRWTIVTLNVFGDWQGDLVMPSEMYFSDATSIGNSANTDISEVQKVILNIDNNNTSTIDNNVTVNTDTGNNAFQTQPDAHGNEGDIKDTSTVTGNNDARSKTQNVTNISVYNSKWFLGLINVLGDWSGHVYSLPDSVAVQYQPTGFTFVSSSDPAAMQQLEQALQPDVPATTSTTSSDTLCQSGCDTTTTANDTEQTVDIANSNTAAITNNVTVDATTGQNTIQANGDIKRDTIKTGTATALVNILNFANANLVNADLHVGLVNVFGKWQGNVVFGYPDLAVTQTSPQTEVSGSADAPLNVQLVFSNQAPASIAGTKLEWKYNPNLFTVDTLQSAYSHTETNAGDIVFTLGKVSPNQTGSISIQLKTKQAQAVGLHDDFFAHIFGMGLENNLTNNQSLLTLQTAAPPAPDPGSTPPDSGSGSTPPGDSGSTPTPPPPPPPPADGSGGTGDGSSSNNSSGSDTGGSNTGAGGSSTGSSDSGNSGGGNNPPGGGAGQNNTSGGIGIIPNLLRVYKSNTANGGSVPAGAQVDFTITVDNDGNNMLHSLVVYDTLRGPDNSVLNSQTYDVGDMLSRQEVSIRYSFVIAATAIPGTYTNSVYVQGLNDALQTVRSESTALSSFTVAAGTVPSHPAAAAGPAGAAAGAAATPGTPSVVKPAVTAVETKKTATQPVAPPADPIAAPVIKTPQPDGGRVLGESCINPDFTADLQSGAKGDSVKALQTFLNNNGFALAQRGAGSPGFETANFGPLLKAALTAFQKKNGIKERGVFRQETRTKVNELLNTSCQPTLPAEVPVAPPAPVVPPVLPAELNSGILVSTACVRPAFTENLQSGSRGDAVKALQIFLNNNGFIIAKSGAGSPGLESSAFGPLSKVALTAFQKQFGLTESGVFGSETREKVNSMVNISGAPFCVPTPAPAKTNFVKAPVKKPTIKTLAPKDTPPAPEPQKQSEKPKGNIFSGLGKLFGFK